MRGNIPLLIGQDRVVNQVQQNVVIALRGLLNNPITNGGFLTSIVLASGDNTVNHTLGRKLTGWIVVRCRAAATFYDKQDTNTTPEQTLTLHSSAAVTVDLYVF